MDRGRRDGLRAGRAAMRSGIGAGCLATGLAALVVWTHHEAPGVPQLDSWLHEWALHQRTAATIGLARGFSWFGQTNVALPLVVLAGVAAAVETRRFARVRAGALLVGVGSVGVALGLGINRATARIRPPLTDWAGAAGGFAFPSGHTTAATVAAGLVAWTVSRHLKRASGRVAVWVAASAWAAGVGWSRVWLGVHWPTDVLGGWLFAGSFLLAARTAQLIWWPADAPPVPPGASAEPPVATR
ncbi:phosphoesterase [Cellulomonas sp. WB94]|uniref:phosphatase PAP2 family protein n=1 Tax=Cellulomonas sp. WB94 TaxID=2173174 RepID=UPI000D56C79B|nr:phosphatase PAP2 family protein [Cellulomonas sp. WB94]PVU81185.1 phosphoesterase [Cellulomonas sp. WB94]